jgi:serine/threonine protein kinase
VNDDMQATPVPQRAIPLPSGRPPDARPEAEARTGFAPPLNALAVGSMLAEYRIEGVLGSGGFGITYLGRDTHLEKRVAIKEFLPASLAVRTLDGSIMPVNTDHRYNYAWGLDRFLQEARTLARFSHPNIVGVNRYFPANGTGYMVMHYEDGESLNARLKRERTTTEAAIRAWLLPLLDGLEAVHRAGFLHRDIKPSNIFIRADSSPVLLDFGASREASGDCTLTAIVTPGYAAFEQYARDGNQGPWSDVYSMAAVLFRAVTGDNPPDAVSRMKADRVPSRLAAFATSFDPRFLAAIDLGLALDERRRPANVAAWRCAFNDASETPRSPKSRERATGPGAAAPARPFAPASQVPALQANAAATIATADAPGVAGTPASGSVLRWTALGLAAAFAVSAAAQWWTRHRDDAVAPVSGYVQGRIVERPIPHEPPPSPVAPSSVAPAASLVSDRAVNAFREADRLPPPARAESSPPRRDAAPFHPDTGNPRGEPARSMARAFADADVDGDGYLSMEEARRHMRPAAERFREIDADGDGRLSLDELRRFRGRNGPRAPFPPPR